MLAGTLLLTATGLFAQVVGFLYRMLLSRLIGAETMGLYQLVMPVYSMLMSVTAVGLTVAVSTLSARYHALGDDGAVKSVLRRALRDFFLLAVPLGLAVAALSDPISVYVLGDARTRLGVVLLVPCMLLTGVENLHKHCFYGIGRVRPPAAVETAEQVIRAAAVLLLLAALLPRSAEETVGIIALGMVLCEVFSACALTLLFRRHWRRFPPGPAGEVVSGRRLISIALPVGATSLLGTLLGSANSVLIPAKLVEGGMTLSEAMSEFGVMCGMTLPMLGLPTGFIGALCLVMVPDLSRRTARGDRRAAGGFLNRVMSATSLLMAPAMALLAIIGPTVGAALFRDERVGGLIVPLAAGTLLGCWQSVLSGALNGLGLQGKAARNAIVSDAVQLAFTFFSVSRFGLAGFAAGFVASGIAGAGLNLASVLRATGLRAEWFSWFVRPLLSAGLMGLWCNLLFRIMLAAGCGGGWSSLVCGLLGAAMYSAALLAQGVTFSRPAFSQEKK
ncbi:MAG: oligosaccharide flippase family protein [Clostridiales bacterium]|nr:oligosaccharide flippase family protein [Clostridiales bacterium]